MLADRRLLLIVSAVLALPLLVDDLSAQSLRGSRAKIDRVYRHAASSGLHFYQTSQGIRNAARDGRLVALPGNANYRLHAVSYPYALPAARTFVERLAAQYRAACGEQLVVTSASRPRAMRLPNSVSRSVHPTGMAIDLRKPTNPTCLRWLRNTLLQLTAGGVIEATEEFRPPHFHVAIYPAPYSRYVQRRGGSVYAAAPRSATMAQRYQVRPGDSLWAIARRHRTSVNRLQLANNLRTTTIRVGQVLVIPD